MSYPYGQYPGENFANPTTALDAFPAWDTMEHEEQPSRDQQSKYQDQQLEQQQPELHSPTGPPPTPQQYQTIQLDEQTPIVPSQPRIAHDDTPIYVHPTYSRSERRRESLRESESRVPRIDMPRSSSTSTSMGPGPVRPTRSHAYSQSLPYRRPPSPPSAPPPQRQREHTVRFASSQSAPSSSLPSPAIPSPLSATSRMASFGSGVASPRNTPDIPALMRLRSEPGAGVKRRFIVRTDSHYDPETKLLTAILELPGVKKTDVRVTLSTCYYNRVKQITVSGQLNPVFPSLPPNSEAGGPLLIRERKYGEFVRTFAVPAETKREDVDAHIEDGILTVKIPCGTPVSPDDEDIPIR